MTSELAGESWSFEGGLNRVSRIQTPDANLVLAKNVDIFDPLTTRLLKGYRQSFVMGSNGGFEPDHENPIYFHVHNITLPVSFELDISNHKVKGYPLIIQGEDFFEVGIYVTGLTIKRNPSNMSSLCTVILRKMNNLEYAELLDSYKEKS